MTRYLINKTSCVFLAYYLVLLLIIIIIIIIIMSVKG